MSEERSECCYRGGNKMKSGENRAMGAHLMSRIVLLALRASAIALPASGSIQFFARLKAGVVT